MKISLFHRHFGIHSFIKQIEIDARLSSIVKKCKSSYDDFIIDEDAVLDFISKKWLPIKPDKILLTIGDKHGSTAQRHPKYFRRWGKYFDAYILELSK